MQKTLPPHKIIIIQCSCRIKKIKILGINLNKKVNDLYMEKYEALMKDIKEDTNKCKAISCSQTGRINMAEMPSTDSTQSQAKCQWRLHRNR